MAREDNIGALWAKERGSFSGYVEIDGKRVNIVCFVNTYKKEAKHPDYNILISKPKNRDEAEQELNNPNPEMQPEPGYENIKPEDIPF